eukprot:352041_1
MALKSVMNVQSPLRDVGFFGPSSEGIYCLTGSETMSMWHHDSAQRICDFGGNVRQDLTTIASTGTGGVPMPMPVQYLVGCQWNSVEQELHLLAGNPDGDCAMFRVNANSIELKRILSNGHKGCIRGFIGDDSSAATAGSMITVGEDSRLCEWNCRSYSGTNDAAAAAAAAAQRKSTISSRPKSGGGVVRRHTKKKGHTPY